MYFKNTILHFGYDLITEFNGWQRSQPLLQCAFSNDQFNSGSHINAVKTTDGSFFCIGIIYCFLGKRVVKAATTNKNSNNFFIIAGLDVIRRAGVEKLQLFEIIFSLTFAASSCKALWFN